MTSYPQGVTSEMIEAIHGEAKVSNPACSICGKEHEGRYDEDGDWIAFARTPDYDEDTKEHIHCIAERKAMSLDEDKRTSLAIIYRALSTALGEMGQSTIDAIESEVYMLDLRSFAYAIADMLHEVDGGLDDEPAWIEKTIGKAVPRPRTAKEQAEYDEYMTREKAHIAALKPKFVPAGEDHAN